MPVDEEPQIPKGVRREIDRVLGRGDRARDVALALSVGGEAIDLDELAVAREVLGWAKHVAPRIPAVREAYGVALYLDEDWAGALTELQAYRRMSGRVDQNHVIADCLRGLGRGLDRVAEVVGELLEEPRAPEDRRAEGVIVWASAMADADDVPAARALLRQFLDHRERGGQPHDLRVRAVAARLAEQEGDVEEAGRQRALVAAGDPELFETIEAPSGTAPGGEPRDADAASSRPRSAASGPGADPSASDRPVPGSDAATPGADEPPDPDAP